MRPLEGLVVLEFCQYLSGPSATLRLADLGARVIKIERPGSGDGCRQLLLNNLETDEGGVLFQTINRNKESYAADLKNPQDLAKLIKLIGQADVLVENFRPGTLEKIGLGYEDVKKINPRIVYGTVTGYGKEGPWKNKPGQDLLVQSLTGLAYLNGNGDQPPMPFALAIADMITGAQLAQGILACLVRRGRTDEGGLVEVSLLESMLDFQFEVLTTYLNDGGQLPERSHINNAHAYLGAPYGIYETQDGYIALAMGSIVRLGQLLECPEVAAFTDPKEWFTRRDEIKGLLVEHLKQRTTEEWLSVLEPADYWSSDVFTWDKLMNHEGFKVLDMIQEVGRPGQQPLRTTRCPIRINGERIKSAQWAPAIGENNGKIEMDFNLIDG
ncbi:CoA transferase [Paenibacillus sp. LMG 31461]|uniref:CoA transferase n=1 Tax=Paenibacillus plantarum TaxID=2654975 RepID=A0ABX1X6J5_9BACL|nr:CaiB/BaiF CoA-transferase family protein [Paenibacillus plantarum]NOU64032.1 CoA transferase [Paenibacillus plantarum]